jgi:uncharacterized protein (DUF2147 family)
MAVTGDNATSGSASDPPATVPPSAAPEKPAGKNARNHAQKENHVDPARQAWAHKYGLDRSTMPNLADLSRASPEQRAAALDLLVRTEAATAQYNDLAKAKAAGFDLEASLAKAEKKRPGRANQIQRIDAGQQTDGKMPMLHVGNPANHADGKVLDPSAPETLMYAYDGQGQWKLVGVMYSANESYPNAPPDPGGPITRWHYHDKSGGQRLMMHIFFVPGNDLAHAYAAEMVN